MPVSCKFRGSYSNAGEGLIFSNTMPYLLAHNNPRSGKACCLYFHGPRVNKLRCFSLQIFTEVSEELAASIFGDQRPSISLLFLGPWTVCMDTARSYEISGNVYEYTSHNIPENVGLNYTSRTPCATRLLEETLSRSLVVLWSDA
jgi:hypothetical protein